MPGEPTKTGGKPADEQPPNEGPEAALPASEAPASESDKQKKTKRSQVPVAIKSDPEGSHVTTGHHSFGTTPLTLKLRPGNSYEFTFTKAGYTPLTRRYRFDDEEPQTLRVALKKAPPAPKPAAPPPVKPAPPVKQGWFGR
jgi:hypothetical protein